MAPVITLTTDFGLDDGYVASLKGAILSVTAGVQLVDISHTIAPQNIRRAAFLLHCTQSSFPAGTIHLVVVDPGVGGSRRAIALKTPLAYFVAPDNGVLSYVIDEYCPGKIPSGSVRQNSTTSLPVVPELEAVELNRQEYRRNPVSPVFHGRDIFAPAAAYLAGGVPLRELGDKVTEIRVLHLPRMLRNADGSVQGNVIHIDSFGNLITNIKETGIMNRSATVTIADRKIAGIHHYYAELEGLGALIGSSGYLEISLRNGSAQKQLDAVVGDRITVSF